MAASPYTGTYNVERIRPYSVFLERCITETFTKAGTEGKTNEIHFN
jgi:hypothetical protein